MKIEQLFSPVDKKAAVVTSQRGCTGEYTDEQRRDNLKAHLFSLRSQLDSLPKFSKDRKELGIRIHEIQNEMHAIRPKRRCPGIEKYILDILREEMTKFEWNRLMERARKRMEACNNG